MSKAESERQVVAFLGYHRRTGRTHFVDHIHVHRDFRQRGYAAKLLRQITTGPVELIVRRDNFTAQSSYLKLGFCAPQRLAAGAYEPDNHQLAMRTVSYRASQALMDIAKRGANRPLSKPYASFDLVPKEQRKYMLNSVMATETRKDGKPFTQRDAEKVLAPHINKAGKPTGKQPVEFHVLTVSK